MAAYGTLVAWARAMGYTKAADLREETLDEEKAADATLSRIAKGGINQGAAETAHPKEGEGRPAARSGSRKASASKAKAGARR